MFFFWWLINKVMFSFCNKFFAKKGKAILMTQKFIKVWFLTQVNEVLHKKVPTKPSLIFKRLFLAQQLLEKNGERNCVHRRRRHGRLNIFTSKKNEKWRRFFKALRMVTQIVAGNCL